MRPSVLRLKIARTIDTYHDTQRLGIDKPRQSYASADLKIRTRTKLTLMLITITSQLPGGNVNSAIDVSRSIDVVSSIAVSCPKRGGLGYFGQLPMQDQDLAVVPL